MADSRPLDSDLHNKLISLAEEIHDAVWDRMGLATVQEYVRQWAEEWQSRADSAAAAKEETWAAYEGLEQVALEVWHRMDFSPDITDSERDIEYLKMFRKHGRKSPLSCPKLPELPLPTCEQQGQPLPTRRERSPAEKWAALAAVHDEFYLGAPILPWPLPDNEDLEAMTDWMRGDGGTFMMLMGCARGLTDHEANCIARWLKDALRDATVVKTECQPADEQQTTVSERGNETLDEQDTNGLIGKGVAPRDEWFVRQYEASGTDTYHKPAKVHHKWDTMRMAERVEICPDAPNKVTKSAVEQAIKRFIKKRDRQE